MTFRIDAICFTESAAECLASLRDAAGMSDGPVERHSARVFFIMERLAQQASLPMDREVAACSALLHDIGLYDPAARPRFYLRHGRASAERLIGSFGWSGDRIRRCLDAIELHHRLSPQWGQGAEVELLRIADLVDASRGIARFGLERQWLAGLFDALRRDGLQRELLRHSLRGAPCLTRGIVGTFLNAPRGSLPRQRDSRQPADQSPDPHA